ncbi:MAG: HAD-IA family hydrolase [Oscillibacter sp.]
MRTFFDAIFTCSEVGHGKDEPVIFRRAMEHFGAQRGSTVVFEDAIHAVETAKKDGFTVAAVFDERKAPGQRGQSAGGLHISRALSSWSNSGQ